MRASLSPFLSCVESLLRTCRRRLHLRYFVRSLILSLVATGLVVKFYHQTEVEDDKPFNHAVKPSGPLKLPSGILRDPQSGDFSWADIPWNHPIQNPVALPTHAASPIPRIQHKFRKEDSSARRIRQERLAAVRSNFTHAWRGYVDHAFMHDELLPLTGGAKDPFCGWAATLVDTLDTLWIMGFQKDFEMAVDAVSHIDFSTATSSTVSLFETTIRYLGGLLAAYDVSGWKYPVLLRKAVELGDLLYKAFDTPNNMPIDHMYIPTVRDGKEQFARQVVLADVGSHSLEFTRLSQLTGDMKYYDAIQRVMDVCDEQQSDSSLPGLWPTRVDLGRPDVASGNTFGIGNLADSFYEYIPKEWILLGGAKDQYRKMWEQAYQAMDTHLFYRPMTKTGEHVLFPGVFNPNAQTFTTIAEHLGCFAGGMVGLAAAVFENTTALDVAEQLTRGCLWAYETNRQGIMPESMTTLPCQQRDHCEWDEDAWHKAVLAVSRGSKLENAIESQYLEPGIVSFTDGRYVLRPEAVESALIMYRITGDQSYADRAWKMFEAIVLVSKTEYAHAAVYDARVPNPPLEDNMESFWLGETLKYFYLMFTTPDVISLDEYVFNTEAHPLRRPS